MTNNNPEKEGDNYPDEDRVQYVVRDQRDIPLVKEMVKEGMPLEEINEMFGCLEKVERKVERDADLYCPMDASYVCQCERVKILQDTVDALVVNGNLILDYLKAWVQTTDPELIDTLPERIEEVQEIFRNRS